MKMKKAKVALLLLLVFLSSSFSVLAKEKLPNDIEKCGSITIQLDEGGLGTSKEHVGFAFTKVADLVDGFYELKSEYKSSNIDLNKIKYAKDMERAASELVKIAKPDSVVYTDKTGVAAIHDLPMGVYLVYVTEKAKYDEVVPSLIAIPTWDEEKGDMLYDIEMYPKHTPWPPGTIETDTPNGNYDGVKTGDKSPFLLMGIVALISAGIIGILFVKAKKDASEEARDMDLK